MSSTRASDLRRGRLEGDTLYVVLPADAVRVQAAQTDVRCGRIYTVTFCTTLDRYPLWQRYAETR